MNPAQKSENKAETPEEAGVQLDDSGLEKVSGGAAPDTLGSFYCPYEHHSHLMRYNGYCPVEYKSGNKAKKYNAERYFCQTFGIFFKITLQGEEIYLNPDREEIH